MHKLNNNGRILIQYREEFIRHHSESVDEALKSAVLTLYESKKIDERVFRAIFDESITNDEFEVILTKKNDFTKNASELGIEFDKVRKSINEYMISIGFINNMTTKNSIELNKISIIRQFDLDRNFIVEYFGLTQSELIPLMRRRGFMEKFSVLRLNEIMRQVFKELRTSDDIDHAYSLVYYNKITKSFSIDYKYHINIDLVKDPERMKVIISKIKELDKVVERKFTQKLGCQSIFRNNTNLTQQKETQLTPIKKTQQINPPATIIAEATKNPSKTIITVGNKPVVQTLQTKHSNPIKAVEQVPAKVEPLKDKELPSVEIVPEKNAQAVNLPTSIPMKKPQDTPVQTIPVSTEVKTKGPEIIIDSVKPKPIDSESQSSQIKQKAEPSQKTDKLLDVLFDIDKEDEEFL